jgi:hypothetical protein
MPGFRSYGAPGFSSHSARYKKSPPSARGHIIPLAMAVIEPTASCVPYIFDRRLIAGDALQFPLQFPRTLYPTISRGDLDRGIVFDIHMRPKCARCSAHLV